MLRVKVQLNVRDMSDPAIDLEEAHRLLRHHPGRALAIYDAHLKAHPDDPFGLLCRHQAWAALGELR